LGLYKRLLGLADGLFVDVGVNLGQTLIQLRQIDRERPYLGFEPNPDCLHYVDTLIRRNSYAHVELLAVGIGENTGVLSLYLPPGRSTDSTATLIKDLRPDRDYDARQVPIFSEDHLVGLIGDRKLGVVKVDVEGS
jgi:FkbM family methyltransferase